MKTVVFIRHGKSSWEYDVSDKDRPLKERGIVDGHLVGEKLKALNLKIDQVYSSPANRALHTCMIVVRNLGYDLNKVKITERLYDFSGYDVLEFLKSLENNLETVVIFGHNHAFTSLVNSLGDVYIENVPTSGSVIIEFETDSWNTISEGKTVQQVFPKNLR